MKKIDKEKFYPTVIEMIGHAQKSVSFYSISSCFGFYSLGLKNFENVILALEERIKKQIRGKFLDIRVVVKSDNDNPIDNYAVKRLAYLEKEYKEKGLKNIDRIIFKEFEHIENGEIDNVQFLIIDDNIILISQIQEVDYNKTLDLNLNKSEKGLHFEKEEDPKRFNIYKEMFESKWDAFKPFNIQLKQITKLHLKTLLRKYRLGHGESSERDFQMGVASYLINVHKLALGIETTFNERRVDLTVGVGPIQQKHAIEIKYKPKNDAIKGILGQIEIYKKQFESLFLVIAEPEYSMESRQHLIDKTHELNIELIELKSK